MQRQSSQETACMNSKYKSKHDLMHCYAAPLLRYSVMLWSTNVRLVLPRWTLLPTL